MQVKTSDLSGNALDYAVAVCEGYTIKIPSHTKNWTNKWLLFTDHLGQDHHLPKWTTDWSQGGPIIEREIYSLKRYGLENKEFRAVSREGIGMDGLTPLIAAMRCYVASKLGDTVEIPEELVKV